MQVKSLPFKSEENPGQRKKYQLPDFLGQVTSQKVYQLWLYRKATAHHRRDKGRCIAVGTPEMYRMEIHRAVMVSRGLDFYTSESLDWLLLSKYRNEPSKGGRTKYKKMFALLPTVDHVGDAEGRPYFVICGWRTNDSKSDLSYEEFVAMCARVLETARGRDELIRLHSEAPIHPNEKTPSRLG